MTTPFVELQTPKNLDIISDVCFMDNTDQHRLLVSNWNSEILLFSCDSLLHEHQPHIYNQSIHLLLRTFHYVYYMTTNRTCHLLLDCWMDQYENWILKW